MRIHVVEEFPDLRDQALVLALEALGHEVTSDARSAEVMLCRDPHSKPMLALAKASGATLATHAEFLRQTALGAALLRFGELLRPVLDGEEGIGCGIDEPLTDSDADVPAMLAMLRLSLPPQRPLGLGFQLVQAAEALRAQKKYELALSTLEVAFECGDDIRTWAQGEATGAFSSALWLLQPGNTGIPPDDQRVRWFLARCLPNAATDLFVHLEAARLYGAVNEDNASCAELNRFLQRGAFFLADVESDPRLERIRAMPSAAAAIAAARASLPKDPQGVLEPLLQNREACAQLYPAPVPRSQPPRAAPFETGTVLAELYGRALPPPLEVWLDCLDRWDIGYREIYDWRAWHPVSTRRDWAPLSVPDRRANAFEWLFELDGSGAEADDWKTRAVTATQCLVFAGAVPVGRTKWGRGEFGVHVDPDGQHDEVVLLDREKDALAVVASGLDGFIAYQARASGRGKRALAEALPPGLGARVRFGNQLSGGDYAVHGEGEYAARSQVTELVRRSTWIVDLLNGVPKLSAIVADYGSHAAASHELDLVLDQPHLNALADGLYWIWHLYFVGEDALLRQLLPRAASSSAKYLRDAAELAARALERPTQLGRVQLADQRDAFIERLGKTKRTIAFRGVALPPAEQACDREALLAALESRRSSFESFPSEQGKVTPAAVEALIADMPDTFGDYFAGVQRPDMPAAGGTEFALALLIEQTLTPPLAHTKHAEDLEIEDGGVTIYYGNLEVSGALSFEGLLIVLGDLVVDGVLEDSDEFAHLWVTGALRARAIHCQFTGWVGKNVATSGIVMGRRGSLFAVEGIDSPLAIKDSDEGLGFRGSLRAEHHLDSAKDDGILSRMIAKKFLEVDDDFVSLDADALLMAVAKGKRVLTG